RAAINFGNPILATRNRDSGEAEGVSVDIARELDRELGINRSLSVLPPNAAAAPPGSDDADLTVVRVQRSLVDEPATMIRPGPPTVLRSPSGGLPAEADADAETDSVGVEEPTSPKRTPAWLKLSAVGAVALIAIVAVVALTRGSSDTTEMGALQPTTVLRSSTSKYTITGVAFSGDSSQVVTTGSDGTVRSWNATSGDAVRTIDGEYGVVNAQGTVVATNNFSERTSTLWDLASGAQLVTLDGVGPRFSGDGQIIATGEGEESMVWNTTTGARLSAFSTAGYTSALSRDGAFLYDIDYSETTVAVWRTSDGQKMFTAPGSEAEFGPAGTTLVTFDYSAGRGAVWDIATGDSLLAVAGDEFAVSADGSRLAVHASDGATTVWDAATGQQVGSVFGSGMEFNADGSQMISSLDGTSVLWDPAAGVALLELVGSSYSSEFSPDGSTVTSLDSTGQGDQVRLWDAATGSEIAAIAAQESTVAFSPDSSLVAVSNIASSEIALVDLASGHRLDIATGHSDPMWGAYFPPSGQSIVTETGGGSFELWDLDSGASLATTPIDSFNKDMSPDGSKLAVAYDDGTVRVLDATTFEELFKSPGYLSWWSQDSSTLVTSAENRVTSAEKITVWDAMLGEVRSELEGDSYLGADPLSPDGTLVAVPQGEGSTMFSAATGEALYEFPGNVFPFSPQGDLFIASRGDDDPSILVRSADGTVVVELDGHAWYDAFSPDGASLYTTRTDGGSSEVLIWEASTGKERYSVVGDGALFSPDSTLLLTTTTDEGTVVRDAETGQERYRLESSDLVFSPDGTRLAGTTSSGRVTVWDATTGEPLFDLMGADGTVNTIVFNADGSMIAVASLNGTTIVWRLVS
ncbi:MAG: hypothetical protein ABMA25_14145, partial [Ilumatobacteraceae bacterium]